MKEIIIIIILLLVLVLTVQYKNYKRNNLKSVTKNNNYDDINLIGHSKGARMRDNKYEYYSKKKVRFADKPTYYDCPPQKNLNEQDRFIDDYVYNSRVFCKNKPEKNVDSLAEYRRDIFDFRDKTNQIANNYTPVDRIDEVIVNNPDLRGMKISEIYDALTSNEFNTNYESINMPEQDRAGINYINSNNADSGFMSYRSNIY